MHKLPKWIDQPFDCPNRSVQLHNEIILFTQHCIKTRGSDHRIRIIKWISDVADYIWHQNATIEVFGSYACDLYLPNSDIDINIVYKGRETQKMMSELNTVLRTHKDVVEVTDYLARAKVPIIKIKDIKSNINVDIAFNNQGTSEIVANIKIVTEKYPHFKYLVMVFKHYLKIKNNNDTYKGGIGSALLQFMVLGYLQYEYKEKNYNISDFLLSSAMIGFIKFYSKDFKHGVLAISIFGNGTFINKSKLGFGSDLSIINPTDISADMGKAAHSSSYIIKTMKESMRKMLDASDSRTDLQRFFGED